MFDIRIVNLNAGSHLCMTPEKDLSKVKKDKKDLYIQACLEYRLSFTPMVYSMYGIPVVEALFAQNILATLLSFKLK